MTIMKKYMLLTLLCCVFGALYGQKKIELNAPDKGIKVVVEIRDQISYSILAGDKVLLKDNTLALHVGKEVLGQHPKLSAQKITAVDETLTPVVPLKFSKVKNKYNQLSLTFKDGYGIEFRAFDDGVAYRFVTFRKGDIEVMAEEMNIHFPATYSLHLQQTGGFKTAYEEPYSTVASSDWKPSDKMSTLPVLVDTKDQYKILIAESDVSDYPALFLKGNGENGMKAAFPKMPLAFGDDGDRSVKLLKEADYIAKTKGTRTLPWRYFVITNDDRKLIENTMTYQLAPKSEIKNTSWIKPGKVSWEWWNDASPYGPDVNFVAGYNMDTYKYYIDFASKYGIEYIIMDEGWAKTTRDPYTPNPTIDLQELIRYGKSKNVGIVLWLTWLTVENNMDLFKTFSQWGVKGVKIDFMDRSDQWMMDYYERVAAEAAKNQLFVDYHGSISPKGLEYKYPNIISYEGVRGMEQMGGCTPDNSVYFPFMRNAVGPMDYTPGAMISMQPDVYRADRPNSASIGTRAYQMALFVIFESGLQMLADNPTMYYRNAECTEFITQVPTTWDETRALKAVAGEYAIVAKRKGHKWYIGGMTNNAQKERTFEILVDFLQNGRSYKITSFEDGINAGRQAMDYRKKEGAVKNGETLKIKMVRNGGFAAVIE